VANRIPELHERFEDAATEWLAARGIQHAWKQERDWRFLEIPAPAGGFEVHVNASWELINILIDRSIVIPFYPTSKSSHDEDQAVSEAMAYLRALYSPVMRLRQDLRNGKPYRWVLEGYHDGQWRAIRQLRAWFGGWRGSAGERILQNAAA